MPVSRIMVVEEKHSVKLAKSSNLQKSLSHFTAHIVKQANQVFPNLTSILKIFMK